MNLYMKNPLIFTPTRIMKHAKSTLLSLCFVFTVRRNSPSRKDIKTVTKPIMPIKLIRSIQEMI